MKIKHLRKLKMALGLSLICNLGVAQTTCQPWSNSNGVWKGKGRIAISSDGNEHDKDDWAATPFSLALLAAKGLQDQLVLYTYSDHVWGSNHDHSDAEQQMRISALEGKNEFGFTNSIFIEAVKNPAAAYNAMRDEINASSSDNPLFIVAAGPMQVVGEALDRANANKLQYVTVLSHSKWNDRHSDNPSNWENHSGWTWDEMVDEFTSKGVNFDHIVDQNGGTGYDGMRANKSKFSWLNTSTYRNDPHYKSGSWAWLYDRQVAAKKGDEFDPSDAGLIIYLLTGKEKTDPSDAKAIMESPQDPCSGGGGGEITDINDLTVSSIKCDQVTLNWTDVDAEDAYRIRRKIQGGSYIIVTDVNAGTTSYIDNSVTENTDYIYQVRPMQNGKAVKVSNTPLASVPTCGTTGGGTISDVNDLSVSDIECDQVTLNWSDVDAEDAYRIRRKIQGEATFTTLGDVNEDVTTFVDNNVNEETIYIYQVRPMQNGKAVKASNNPTAEIPTCDNGNTGVVTDIDDLTIESVSCTAITLVWSDVDAEDAYRVRRKKQGESTFKNLGDVAANVTSYIDNNLSPNTTYIYQVRPMQNGKAVKVSNNPSANTNGCTKEANTPISEDLNFIEGTVRPNPFSGKIYVSFSTTVEIKEVSVVNINGLQESISAFAVSHDEVSLDLSSLANGTYDLKIVTDKGVLHKRVIKTN